MGGSPPSPILKLNIMEFDSKPKPLHVTMSTQTKEKPRLTFWFKRKNGETFCVHEREAWKIMKGRVKIRKPQGGISSKKFEYLGASDGTEYFKALAEAKQLGRQGDIEGAKELIKLGYEMELDNADKSIVPGNMDIMGDPKAVQYLKRKKGL